MHNKLIVILGPTASGKTDLSIKLAKKFGGEIISADSRQVYKGLDIGSGKITKKDMNGIPHYMLDVANPKRKFSVAQFQKSALKKIQGIQRRGRVPFLVGGTGFYIQSIVDGLLIPEVKPNWKLRKKLEKKSVEQLFSMLRKLDPTRAKSIDAKNQRRLIRALEIVITTGNPLQNIDDRQYFAGGQLNALQIGIKKSKEELKKAIQKRIEKRLKQGMIEEVKKLKKSGLSWKRLEELGLEYRFVAQYIQNKISYQEMVNRLQKETEHFASRQRTWFKRDIRIRWVTNYKEAFKIVKDFLDGR